MKKLHLFKRTLLLLALIVGCVNYGWAETYVKVTNSNDLVSGGVYIIATASSIATSYSSSNFNTTNSGFTESSGTITTSTASPMEFTLGVISNNYTLKMSDDKYLGYSGSSTSFRNSETSASATNEQWTIAYNDTYKLFTIVNVKTTTRFIGTGNGVFKVYANMTNNAPATLYKKQTASVTSLSVKTAPTKTNYKVGETLDLTGLVLNADGNDVTSGYTASPANGATLSEVGEKTVTISYGGQETTQTIHVGSLQSIAITTAPTKKEYNQGQDFDATGMVVKATFSDEETTPTVWEETIAAGDYSVDPSTNLQPANTSVTVSYTWNEVEETANQTITVNAATAYTVTFNAGTGSCATSSLPEAAGLAGVELPTATIGVTGWSFAGWATAATENTEVAPTLYTAGSTYHPIDNCTLYAVYKFTEGTEGEYKRATSVSEITTAGKVVIVSNRESKMLDNTFASNVAAPEEESSVITAAAKDVFVLTGNDTDGYTLTNGLITIGVTGTDNNTVISNTTTNSTWTINAHNTDDAFYFLNKAKGKLCLEHSGSAWCVYAPSTPSTNQYNCLKVYIPNFAIVYNSNPAAIINPTVAFTTAGDKALYVKNENSYTNVANVTGIAKTPVYTSSDATVATVSDAGVVTALKAGTTTITATVAAEVGVNTEASASYEVTVKDASNIAGLKDITNESSVVAFTADLTDAVVTYVDGDYAYIQDEYGAVYASCGSSLTAGNKINGAISGSIKAAYKIDEITAIDLSEATVTEDGIIPAADVKTLAEIKAAGTNYDGKLVTVNGLKVTTALTDEQNGDITDDDGTTSFKLVCPYEGVNADRYAEGNITGFISIYNASTYRLNIYDQSQIVLTKNAPTAQTLSFESDAIELDEETTAFAEFTGQAVEGAQGTVTYAITGAAIGTVNAETGVVTLNGAYGTATITATAAAKEVTEAGVTTPYTETAKSYTVTVNPRYMVTFSVNGVETVLRQATSGATIDVPTPAACGDYTFVGWSTSTVAPTDDKPSMTDLGATVTPENNGTKYFAVFAIATGTPLVEHTSTFTIALDSAPSSPVVDDGSSWTWSNLTFTTTNNGACINKTYGTVTVTLPDGGKAVSLNITKTGNPWSGEAAVVLKDASSNTLKTYTGSSLTYSFTEEHNQSESYTLTNTTGKNAWVDHITFSYTTGGVSYSDYRTSLPPVEVTITTAKYATFASPYATDFSETGITVYTAKDNATSVTLNEVTSGQVPANTPVVLYKEGADGSAINVPVIASAEAVGDNDLEVSDGESATGEDIYVLANKSKGVGFYPWTSGSSLSAGKVFLRVAGGSAAREFIGFEEGETTSLREVRGLKADVRGDFYDLSGRKVAQPTKGLYIVNGRKVVIK